MHHQGRRFYCYLLSGRTWSWRTASVSNNRWWGWSMWQHTSYSFSVAKGVSNLFFCPLCLESFWPVIPKIIVDKLPTVCFHALYQLLVCLAERTAGLWMPLAWHSGITGVARCVRACVCVCVRVCLSERRRLRCPWGGDRLLGGNSGSGGTAIREQLEPLISRYITYTIVGIDCVLLAGNNL